MSFICFLLEPSQWLQESVRRWHLDPCPGSSRGYHETVVVLGLLPSYDPDSDGMVTDGEDHPAKPRTCHGCGQNFGPDAPTQHLVKRLYKSENGLLTTLSDAPPGAMWYADWYPWKGPDGHCLVVKTPGGEWLPDAPSWVGEDQKGNPWTRTGAVPHITATPSIHILGAYHGWLTNGILTEV